MNDEILTLLKHYPLNGSGALGFFSNHPVHSMDREGRSMIINGISDRFWSYIVSESENELKILMDRQPDYVKNFALAEDWMKPFLIRDRAIADTLETLRYVNRKPGKKDGSGSEFTCADVCYEDLDEIIENSHYSDYLSKEYLLDCIRAGFTVSVQIGGVLAGWALTHDDLAIGNLHVKEPYRQKGLGGFLVRHLAVWLLNDGYLPVMNIEEKNTASLKLAESEGFERDRRVSWLILK